MFSMWASVEQINVAVEDNKTCLHVYTIACDYRHGNVRFSNVSPTSTTYRKKANALALVAIENRNKCCPCLWVMCFSNDTAVTFMTFMQLQQENVGE